MTTMIQSQSRQSGLDRRSEPFPPASLSTDSVPLKLSVVTTLFHSELYIDDYYQRITNACQQLVGNDYELIMVNDGSPDQSLNKAIQWAKIDPHIIIIDLSRNFGHHKAIMTGLAQAQGEQIFLIDSELEEEPELLLSFASEMEQVGGDVVFGVQRSRKGKFFERITGHLFYKFYNQLTGMNLVPNCSTIRLMTKRYIKALLQHQEREIYIHGLWNITGFEQHILIFDKHSTSQTTYTLRRKFALLMNSITAFSNAPLIAIFYIGIGILSFSGMYTLYLIFQRLFFDKFIISGWTSVMASIWLLGGLIISLIGVVGIYLSKVFLEIKQRPYTIIRDIYQYSE